MTVIPKDATDAQLREAFGADADAIIAFRRFLACPKDDDGRTLVDEDMHAWATGKISAKELLERQEAR